MICVYRHICGKTIQSVNQYYKAVPNGQWRSNVSLTSTDNSAQISPSAQMSRNIPLHLGTLVYQARSHSQTVVMSFAELLLIGKLLTM